MFIKPSTFYLNATIVLAFYHLPSNAYKRVAAVIIFQIVWFSSIFFIGDAILSVKASYRYNNTVGKDNGKKYKLMK